jgi:Uncharacterized protein conserved in bacteria
MRQHDFEGVNGVKTSKRRAFLGSLLLGASIAMGAFAAPVAAAYPERPVKLVVPFPAGGSTDAAARIVARGLEEAMSANFVVENRAGAAGTVGMGAVLRSAADGYTLGVGPVGATIIAKLIGMQVPYDPARDIMPIAGMGSLPLVLAVKADLPVNSLQELVALAKSRPGELSYGTSGAGTPGHLGFEYLKKMAGIDIVHVPYKGDAPLTTDLQGGQLEIGVLTGPAAAAQAKNDRLKLIAVTSASRYPQIENVPTVAEAGFPGYDITIWNVLVAPAGTSPEVVSALNRAMSDILAREETKQTLRAQGFVPPALMTPQEAADFVERERKA